MPNLDDHEKRLRSLEGWQRDVALEIKENTEFREHYAPQVDRLVRADEIATAVAARLQSERRLVLSSFQKVGGAIAFGILVLDTLRSFFH